MTDTENMVTLSAENVLLRQEVERLHLALTQSQDLQRLALDGWGQAWDRYQRLLDEVRWLRQELGRLQSRKHGPARTQGETAGKWPNSDHND